MNERLAEITVFEKTGGPLTKRLWLDASGKVCSDHSACVMTRGSAQRLRIADVGELTAMSEKVRPEEALALAALRADLPEKVHIVAKSKLNGQPNTIARTASNIHFRKERPAYALVDFDIKGMPPRTRHSSPRRPSAWRNALACRSRRRRSRSRANATAFCCLTSSCHSMSRNLPAAQSAMFSPTPSASRAPSLPIPRRRPITAPARPELCGAPTGRRGFIHSHTPHDL